MKTQLSRSDNKTKEQLAILEDVRASPYFRRFEPRAYSTYESRMFRPQNYLDEIGVEKIGELVQHGYSLLQISKLLDISSLVFRKWLQNNPGYMDEINAARAFAADEYVCRAEAVLLNAPSVAEEISRAAHLAKHYQWKAEKHDPENYGTKNVNIKKTSKGSFSYSFDIQTNAKDSSKSIVDSVAKKVESLPTPNIDVNSLLGN